MADPVELARDLRIRRPDGTIGSVELSERQQRPLRALAAVDDQGRPVNKTVASVWPKRSGKGLLGALALTWKSLRPGAESICLANTREQAAGRMFDELMKIRDATDWLKASSVVKRRGPSIEFSWGSSIMAVPCTEDVAGEPVTGLLAVDELWAASSEEPYKLLASQTEAAQAQIYIASQTSGQDSEVYRLYEMSLHPARARAARLWIDYIEPAQLRQYYAALERGEQPADQVHPNPFLGWHFFGERQASLDDPTWRKYFCNEWGKSGQLLFATDHIEQACLWQPPADIMAWLVTQPYEIGSGLDRALPGAELDESVWTTVARVARLTSPAAASGGLGGAALRSPAPLPASGSLRSPAGEGEHGDGASPPTPSPSLASETSDGEGRTADGDGEDGVYAVRGRAAMARLRKHYYTLMQHVMGDGDEDTISAAQWEAESRFGSHLAILEVYQSADLANRMGLAELGNPTSQMQSRLFGRMSRAIKEARLHVPIECAQLKRQLLEFEVDTSSRVTRYGTPGTAVDDCVYSLGWAMEAADRAPIRRSYGAVEKAAGM
jgi:hypothetical protein